MTEYVGYKDTIGDGMCNFGLTDERIVRCRNCRHMHTVRNWLGMVVDECWLHADRESGVLGKVDTELDGFCKWGELRND